MELKGMVVEEISVVDEGSNLRKWVLFKRKKGGKRIMARISFDDFLKDLKAEKYSVEDVAKYVELMQGEIETLTKLKVCGKCGGEIEHLCKTCDKDRLEPAGDSSEVLEVGKKILAGVEGVGEKIDKLTEAKSSAVDAETLEQAKQKAKDEVEAEYKEMIGGLLEEMKKLKEALSPENLIKLVQAAVEAD